MILQSTTNNVEINDFNFINYKICCIHIKYNIGKLYIYNIYIYIYIIIDI